MKNDVHFVGKLDKNVYSCVTSDITTDEVIITDTQIGHINDRHPGDYERFAKYIPAVLSSPDYIFEANKPNSAIAVKTIESESGSVKLVVRLHTSTDTAEFKNSIITLVQIDEKTINGLLRNKKLLYKRE